jgi:DNA-binding beta-propeller fold protein YncE
MVMTVNRAGRFLVAAFVSLIALPSVVLAPAAASAVASAGQAASEPSPGTRSWRVYVTNTGFRDSRAAGVAVFSAGADGLLAGPSPLTPTPVASRRITFAPDGRTAYVPSGTMGSRVSRIDIFDVSVGGKLTPRSYLTINEGMPFGMVVAPDGRTAYVSHLTPDAGAVSALRIGPDGALSPLGEPFQTTLPDPKGLAITPDGRFLYVSHGLLDEQKDSVVPIARNADGSLGREGAPADIGAGGAAVTITPDGRFLYVACEVTDDVYGFAIRADGGLSRVPGSPEPTPVFAEGALVSPSGRYLYVATDGGIYAFAVGVGGRLTAVPGSPFAAGNGPIGLAFAPDPRYLYVSVFGDSAVWTFQVRPDGSLDDIQSGLKTGGNAPGFDSVTVLPDRP